MTERPRVLALDMLESYARERDIEVHLERRREPPEWVCLLSEDRTGVRATGKTAREAVRRALEQAGVEFPD